MNIGVIEVTTQKSELTVAMKKRADIENCVSLCQEAFSVIITHLTKHGKQPSGMPYAMTAYDTETENFEIEIGVPVDEEIPVNGELFMSKTYQGKIVTAISKGTFSDAGKLWAEMMKYTEEHNLEPVGIHYDYFLNEPLTAPEDQLLLKLVDPIK